MFNDGPDDFIIIILENTKSKKDVLRRWWEQTDPVTYLYSKYLVKVVIWYKDVRRISYFSRDFSSPSSSKWQIVTAKAFMMRKKSLSPRKHLSLSALHDKRPTQGWIILGGKWEHVLLRTDLTTIELIVLCQAGISPSTIFYTWALIVTFNK